MRSYILTLNKIEPEKRDQKPEDMNTFFDVYGANDDGTADVGDVVHYSVNLPPEEIEEYTNEDTKPSNLIDVEPNHIDSVALEHVDANIVDPVTLHGIPESETLYFHHSRALLDWLQENPKKRKQEVTVAILDTGCDASFPLQPYVSGGASFISGEPWSRTTHFHGMHVAGLAYRHNIGMKLLMVKVLGNNGSGTRDGIVAGIYWAINNGADVINMSLSGPGDTSTAYQTAIAKANSLGIEVWVAMGNTGREERRMPAAAPGARAVIALQGPQDIKTGFSTYGDWAFTSADGYNMLSYTLNGRLQRASGTSMASPYAAGEDAMLVARFGRNSPRIKAFRANGDHKLNIPKNEQGEIGKICVHKANRWMLKNK